MIRLPLLALVVGVAACGPVNRSLDVQKAPVVTYSELAYDLPATGERIDGPALRAMTDYLRAIGLGYGDRVTVTGGTLAQRALLTSVFGAFGATVEAGGAASGPGSIHLAIRHGSATVPGCPDWRRLSNPEVAASAMSNYGCATRSNLAAMVADPSDLVGDKGYAGARADAVAKGIKAYRDKPSTGLEPLATNDTHTTGGGK